MQDDYYNGYLIPEGSWATPCAIHGELTLSYSILGATLIENIWY